ncbi:hypothetical protein AmDm5_2736 [Acetobacter malorum]|nr:hypothetical protein AmDm5_2736 [Acetobacter malorum]
MVPALSLLPGAGERKSLYSSALAQSCGGIFVSIFTHPALSV